jgi:hypothetical protein
VVGSVMSAPNGSAKVISVWAASHESFPTPNRLNKQNLR